jgi:outer membrane protein
MMTCLRRFSTAVVAIGAAAYALSAFAQSTHSLAGEVGLGLYRTPAITKSTSQTNTALPYVYADYGPVYARVDTFGYRLLPMGLGHLEVATRLSFEGYQSDVTGIEQKHRPKPYGLGTFQETPYGAFIFYTFRDATSGGNLFDASYAAEFVVSDWHVYPQLGLERRDRKYVNALYGVSPAEAARSGLATYAAGNSYSPNAAIALEYPLAQRFKLTLQLRKRWLDKAIYDSPLVDVKQQTSGLIAISQTFQ